MTYVFDACALIAFINHEPEGAKVKDLLRSVESGGSELYISIVNLTEVYYNFIRSDGLELANEIMEEVRYLPIKIIDVIDEKVYRETARLKSCYPMSLADAFLSATAKRLDAAIVTKDSEIRAVEAGENLSVFWIN